MATSKMRSNLKRVVFAGLLFAVSASVLADGFSEELINRVKNNVVFISVAEVGNSEVDERVGFGFIVGERDGAYFVATARHTLYSSETKPNQRLKIILRTHKQPTNPIELVAEEVEFLGAERQEAIRLDLAYLQFEPNYAVPFEAAVLGPDALALNPGDSVKLVGRFEPKRNDPRWAASPGALTIDSLVQYQDTAEYEIQFAGNREIQEGQSGAPLVSDLGIVGMVLESARYDQAISISAIKNILKGSGNVWMLTDSNLPPSKASSFDAPKRRIWPWVLGGAAVAALIAGAAGSSGGSTDSGQQTLIVPTP